MIRPLVLTALLVASAVEAGATDYDCSRRSDRDAFMSAMAALRRDHRAVYHALLRRRVGSTAGDSRSCTLIHWCLHQRARVRFSMAGTAPTALLSSVPPSSCQAPWSPLCSSAACSHRTEPLASGRRATSAVFVRAPGGEVRVADAGNGRGGQPLPDQPWHLPLNPYGSDEELEGQMDGISFAYQGEVYTVQFATRHIFRQVASGNRVRFEDTGATLDAGIFEALCASRPFPCEARVRQGCSALGLTRRGRSYRDARRGRWRQDSSGACIPR